jgi:hypothetical protein
VFMARSFFRLNCIMYGRFKPILFRKPKINKARPILFVATFIVAFLIMLGEAPTAQHISPMKLKAEYLEYTTVPGYFQQDDPATNDKIFDYVGGIFHLKLVWKANLILDEVELWLGRKIV